MATDLTLLLPLVGIAALYVAGVRRLPGHHTERLGQYLRAAAGVAVLLVALGPVVEARAEQALTMHMVQHQLLVLVAAPLLVTCGAGRAIALGIGRGDAPPASSPVRSELHAIIAIVAAAAHLGVMLAWHVPYLYDLALRRPEIHHLEHLTMFGSAVLAWHLLLRVGLSDRAAPAALVGFALLAIGGAALGVLMLSTPTPLYPFYGDGSQALAGQRAAGALMKVGALVTYVGAAAVIAARWMQRLERDDDRERQEPTRIGPAGAGT